MPHNKIEFSLVGIFQHFPNNYKIAILFNFPEQNQNNAIQYKFLTMMINRVGFRTQSMNLIHKTQQGSQLWLGDYYAASNTNALKQKNIKSVLTAAAMLNIAYSKEHQINHKIINAFDLPSYRMTPHFQQAFKFISDALKKGNVLVHCAAGISRSTTFVMVYLMRAEGMGFKQALDFVRSKRSIICPNQGFQKELKRYEVVVKKFVPVQKKKEKFIEENGNYQMKQEKQVILDFLKQQKPEKKEQQKMSMTMGTGQRLIPSKQQAVKQTMTGIMRGKSLNYTKKPIQNTVQFANKNATKYNEKPTTYKQRMEESKAITKLNNQFLTFKLQTPKIVTIKK